MEMICSSETVHIRTTWHYIAEDGNFHYTIVDKSVAQYFFGLLFFSFITSIENVKVSVAWSIYYITGIVDVVSP
jgi:hypothetical protein